MKKLLVVLAVLLSHAVSAETYLQINGASIHDKTGYNSFNYGVGIEQTVADRWSVAGGWYRNSEYHGSTYAYGRYSFYQQGPWNLGIGAGVVTGYTTMKVMPMAFPEVCYKWLCAIALPKIEPTGADVLAFRARIPIN